jgi:uncharacterized OsmC-like protein
VTRITVSHVRGDRFTARVRGHEITVDQPRESGGEDAAATPTELFAAALATCVAFYAGRFLRRHADPELAFGVTCDFRMSDEPPARLAAIDISVDVPTALSDDIRAALQRAADHCTLHNTLRGPPPVRIGVRDTVLA